MKELTQPAILASLLALAVFGNNQAQAQDRLEAPTTTVSQASPGEVDTIEHILGAAYKLISGPLGPRDWDHFRSLFLPDARFVASHRDASGRIISATFNTDQFIQRSQAIFDKAGFYESPMANRIEVWDHMAHVWSAYESRHSPGEKPFTRGINSFQLLYDGTRWWVLSIYWQGEDPSHPIPEKYLK